MPWVRVSTGLHLWYQELGAGPPVLLMDGLGSGWVWFKNVPALSRYLRVIPLDHRGTGHSDKPPGPYYVAEMARESADVIRALGAGPCHLVGISLGGSVAMELALTYPGLAAKLVLVGANPGGLEQVYPQPETVARLFPSPVPLTPWQDFIRHMSAALSPAYMATHAAELRVMERLAPPTPAYARQALFWAGVTWPGIRGQSQRLTHPALVLAGERDQLVPTENAYRLVAMLPHARLQLFPGSGHLCQIEQAAAFNQIVGDFLRE